MISCNTYALLGNKRGAAMLEMTLAIPLFMGLLLAMVDFGMYFTTRSVLQSAAYNGAKMACVDTTKVATAVTETVGTVVNTTKYPIGTTITPLGASSTDPLWRYKVQLSCGGAQLSILTSALGLYPITTTGMAKCP